MTEEVTDAMAKVVFDAMVWAVEQPLAGKPPTWFPGGNSFAQDRARQAVRELAAMRSASNSPTTNGEVARRVLRIEWDDTCPVAAVYEQDGIEVMRCSIATNLTPTTNGEVSEPGLDICPDCNGSGEGVADTTCSTCHGTGGATNGEASEPPLSDGQMESMIDRGELVEDAKGWFSPPEEHLPENYREILAVGFIAISGKTIHASNCATSRAPAMMPGPCDCDVALTNHSDLTEGKKS